MPPWGISTSANTAGPMTRLGGDLWPGPEARGAVALPVTSELAAAFLAELAEEGLSVATLRLQKAALAKVHRSAGHQDPTDNEGLKRVMAQDLAASGVELPELMTAGRWKSSRMPARYTERQTAGRGAVARYYQGRRG